MHVADKHGYVGSPDSESRTWRRRDGVAPALNKRQQSVLHRINGLIADGTVKHGSGI